MANVGAEEVVGEEVVLQTFSLPLISIIRTAQGQNGVIHGEFSRYRRHCKNKLQALYKTLKFQHGRTKFIKRKVEVRTVTDARFLHIPLFNAERAWAYAKEFKKQIEGDMDLKKRRHLIARMQKAASWAKDLARLATQRCDARGCLEAQAYAAYMTGTAVAEREKSWGQALALLTRARYILMCLSRLGGTTETQALYLQQVEDMEPAIRYCTYQLTRQGGSEPSETDLLKKAEQEEGSLPSVQLDAQLSSLAQEGAAGGGGVEVTATTLDWQGQSIHVRNDRLKAAVHQVHQLESTLSSTMDTSADQGVTSGSDPRVAVLEKLVKALAEARAAARMALKASTAPEGDASRLELTQSEAALTGLIAQRQVELAEMQVFDAEARFIVGLEAKGAGAAKKGATKGGREGCRPEEVVRLLDGLQRVLMELADVGAKGGGRQGEALYDLATSKSACVRAYRAYYTSHYLLAQNKPLEAYALFGRAAEHAQSAKQESPPPSDAARLTTLLQSVTVFQSVAQAEHAAQAAQKREGVETGVGSLGLSDSAVQTAAQGGAATSNKWLLESLETWESFGGVGGKAPRVYQLPYAMQSFPCRPIMLDTASSHLEYPSLAHRLKKEQKKSVLSSLGLGGWGWGAKK